MDKARFRHELKYVISEKERRILDTRLQGIMQVDKNGDNGCYMIRSLYFDDIYKTAYSEKLAGTPARRKYRIRTYNYSDSIIKLECKNKRDNYIYKESATITREEYEKIINEDYGFLLTKNNELCKRFYIECTTRKLRPVVYVDYDRKTFVMDAGQVRITFDSHVRAAPAHYDMFDAISPAWECMNNEELILEVKYTDMYPDLVKRIISPEYGVFMAVSKFVLCYEKRMEML
ncbi:MAG: polyphosphate polymerase domain-containing protein [Lachnospiraceae bacterium]|nr:polyphosphate polymerase domain-containing protein [Lachnospiraceae bacterium]